MDVQRILDTVGITYTRENGDKFIVYASPLVHLTPMHEKVIAHLFYETVNEIGAPVINIIGLITRKAPDKIFNENMVKKATFYPLKSTEPIDIWIIKEFEQAVNIIVPPVLREPYKPMPVTKKVNDSANKANRKDKRKY